MSSDKLREESVTADRDACFKELCCKAEGWEPEEGWGQEKTVLNTGESVARLDTRDRSKLYNMDGCHGEAWLPNTKIWKTGLYFRTSLHQVKNKIKMILTGSPLLLIHTSCTLFDFFYFSTKVNVNLLIPRLC